MHTSVLLFLIFISHFSAQISLESADGNPGLKIFITRKGLDFANKEASVALNSKIEDVKTLPDINKDISRGYVKAWNMRFTSFSPLKFSYDLQAPNTIIWSAKDGEIHLQGEFQIKKKLFGFIRYRESGEFSVTARRIRISLRADLISTDGRPNFSDVGCEMDIGHLSIELDGGLLASLASILRRQISRYLEPEISAILCDLAVEYVYADLNDKFDEWNPVKWFQGNFSIDYSLTRNPKVNDKGIQSFHRGEVLYLNHGNSSFYPPPLDSDGVDNSKMAYIWISDYVLNSYLNQAFLAGELSFMDTSEHRSMLSFDCGQGFCFGSWDREIRERFGGDLGVFVAKATRRPTVEFGNGTILFQGEGTVQILAKSQEGPQNSTVLMEGTTKLSFILTPNIDSIAKSNRIHGSFQFKEASLNLTYGLTKAFNQQFVTEVKNLMQVVLEGETDTRMRKEGFPLPFKGVSDVEVNILRRTIQIGTDFENLNFSD